MVYKKSLKREWCVAVLACKHVRACAVLRLRSAPCPDSRCHHHHPPRRARAGGTSRVALELPCLTQAVVAAMLGPELLAKAEGGRKQLQVRVVCARRCVRSWLLFEGVAAPCATPRPLVCHVGCSRPPGVPVRHTNTRHRSRRPLMTWRTCTRAARFASPCATVQRAASWTASFSPAPRRPTCSRCGGEMKQGGVGSEARCARQASRHTPREVSASQLTGRLHLPRVVVRHCVCRCTGATR
jgi:hypothetical protein